MPNRTNDLIEVSRTSDGSVSVVRLRRPPHNLLTEPLLASLADAIHREALSARAVVICSEGKSFCAGADFKADDAPDPTNQQGFAQRTEAFYRQAIRIFESPVPLVAAIHGAAIGAGFGLAMACDLRVVGPDAWFQANFVRLGIHPGFALSVTVPLLAGLSWAEDMFLTGRRAGAKELLQIGLAQRQTERGGELDEAIEVATEISQGAPGALAATRRTLRQDLVEQARGMLRHELVQQIRLAGTADAIEGVNRVLNAGRRAN